MAGPGVRTQPEAVPRGVETAIRLMLSGGVIALASLVAMAFTTGDLREVLRAHNQNVTSTTITSTILVAVTIAVVSVIGYVALPVHVRRSRRAARVAALVVAGLNVLSALSVLSQTQTGLNKFFALVSGLVGLGVIGALAMPPSVRYFKEY